MFYRDIMWADSTLEKIEVVYDNIMIYVYNDALQKQIVINCVKCAGMSQICIWDEIIIENIYISNISVHQNQLLSQVLELYGDLNCDGGKQVQEVFKELRIEFINGLSFSVFCQIIDVVLD